MKSSGFYTRTFLKVSYTNKDKDFLDQHLNGWLLA